MRLTVRRKLLLLVAGTLTTALLLVAGALTFLIGGQHETLAGRATHALMQDFGQRLTDDRQRLLASATALASREEIVAMLALLTDYADPGNYQPLIYDEEKKRLARELAEYGTANIAIAAYDGRDQLAASVLPGTTGRTSAITSWSKGEIRLLRQAENGLDWEEAAPAADLPLDGARLGRPKAPVALLRRQGRQLHIEVVVPVTRLRGNVVREVGWIYLSLPAPLPFLENAARERQMTAHLLFSGDFDGDNPLGLRPEDLRGVTLLSEQTATHQPFELLKKSSRHLDTAAFALAGNETAWLLVGLDDRFARDEQRRAQLVALAVLAGSLLLALPLAARLGRRWIGDPLDILRAGAHDFAQGVLDTPIELRSGDEFENLAEDFNLLAIALRVREIAIKEAEERWQFALDSADHGVWDRNLVTGKVFFSPRWKAMLGYADDEIENRFEEWESRLHPDDLPQARAEIERHVNGETSAYRAVFRMRHKNGEWRWIFARGQVINRDAQGRPVRMIGTHTDVTEQRRTQERLEDLMAAVAESEAHYRSFFAEAKAVMLLIDPADGRIIDANPAASDFYGYTHEELMALQISDINLLTPAEVEKEMARAIKEKRDYFIFPHRMKDGSLRTVEMYSGPYHHQNRLILYSIIHDITERVEAERAIREAATVFEATGEAIVITDANGVIKRVNPAFTATTGYAPEQALGRTPRLLKSGRHDARFYAAMWDAMQTHGHWEGEIWNRRSDGEIFPVWQTISAVRDAEGEIVEFVSLFIDITQRKRSEDEIAYRANYDALTGLPNRNLLVERLGQAMKQARRENSRVAVMFIDLDFFKQVNDTLGHAFGDRLLQAVAERMRQCVRETDTIARQGGDEFVVLLADIEDTAAASLVGDKIVARMAVPFLLDDHEIHIGASVGITLYPDDGADIETLFRNADLAMYRAKEAGRNNAQFFEMAMTTAAVERRELEADLRGALAREEFALQYQPVIELASGRIIGAEALLRWRHPLRGLVGPDRFVPLAEETGLIRDIGAWAFATGCRQLAAWQAAGHALTLAINVSVRQLPEALSVAHILATLERHGLAPRQIVLEITEGVLLADSPAVQEWFVAAGRAGLQLAIDDFGTGYSSLAYLKRFPVHHVKIDKAFVNDMATDPADRALVEAILAMAHSLGLTVVAEGVETAEQAGLLQARACEFAQGYLFGRPVDAAEFLALLSGS
ncbi:MAG: EAL domain-containing protein [Pseudomonadota bacterium]